MNKWEYKSLTYPELVEIAEQNGYSFTNDPGEDFKGVSTSFQVMGSHGWELVMFHNYHFVFKRPVS